MDPAAPRYSYANLTRAVRDGHSPLRAYLNRRFPNTLGLRRRFAQASGPLLVPSENISTTGTVGTAFDLQTKLTLDPTHWPTTSFQLDGPDSNAIQSLTAVLHIAGRAAASHDRPEELARAAWALALSTEVFRSGLPSRALASLGPQDTWTPEKLLTLAPPSALRELCELGRVAQGALLPRVQAPLHLGPTFDGSRLCSADADLIAGGTLIELKTRLGNKKKDGYADALKLDDLYQTLAYVLFDFSDSYRIRNVGFYSARYGNYEAHDLTAMLEELAGEAVARGPLPVGAGVATSAREARLESVKKFFTRRVCRVVSDHESRCRSGFAARRGHP